MPKSKCLLGYLTILAVVFLDRTVLPKQTHIFQIDRGGKKLNCRIVFPKDTFLLLEPITAEAWIKNTSADSIQIEYTRLGPWLIQDQKGEIYKHTPDFFGFGRSLLEPGDSTGKSVSIGRFGWQPDLLYAIVQPIDPYLPTGNYKAYCEPDTVPFLFKVILNPSSKHHLRRKKFVEFVETYKPYRYTFDPIWGVPTQLEAPPRSALLERITSTNPVETAYRFFGLNRAMFGIANPRTELKVYKVIKENNELEVHFKQYYRGLETTKDYIIITRFTPEGKLKLVYGTFYPDISLSIIPSISKSEALEIVKHDLGPTEKWRYRNPGSPSLMVFPYKGKYCLAWFIYIYRCRYYLDANTGKIIDKERLPPAF